MWSIGFSKITANTDLSIVLYCRSSIQLLRCAAEAALGRQGRSASESAGAWAHETEHTHQRIVGALLRALELFDLKVGCPWRSIRGGFGGDEETRTPDPLLAKEMLCQLSYVPMLQGSGGRHWTRTSDLCLIRAAL